MLIGCANGTWRSPRVNPGHNTQKQCHNNQELATTAENDAVTLEKRCQENKCQKSAKTHCNMISKETDTS